MGYETHTEGNKLSFQPETVGQLDYKQGFLVELGTADGTCKLLATVGNEIGVVAEVLQPGQPDTEITVRALGKNGTVKMKQSSAIPKNARVVADPANLGEVKALPTNVNGTYRSLGRKLTFSPGAAGDVIQVLDTIETITITGN